MQVKVVPAHELDPKKGLRARDYILPRTKLLWRCLPPTTSAHMAIVGDYRLLVRRRGDRYQWKVTAACKALYVFGDADSLQLAQLAAEKALGDVVRRAWNTVRKALKI